LLEVRKLVDFEPAGLANRLTPSSSILMNIKDWQRAKEERKRSPQKALPSQAAQVPQPVPARLDVLEAELAAIASQPPEDKGNTAEKSDS